MDFQSIALPPELRHQVAIIYNGIVLFPYCGCKGSAFSLTLQIFQRKSSIYFYYSVISINNREFLSSYSKKAIPLQSLSGCSAVGSALRSGRRGRQFESGHPDTLQEAAENQPPPGVLIIHHPNDRCYILRLDVSSDEDTHARVVTG